MKVVKETYLGDGVMAGYDGFHVWVYLADGHPGRSALEGIALEPGVLSRLFEFVATVQEKGGE